MRAKYKEGDLVEYIETFYNNIHKIHICVILNRKVETKITPAVPLVMYVVMTSEGRTLEVWEEEILPMEKRYEDKL